jgi:ABC-type Na+ efflux pump permease subunit
MTLSKIKEQFRGTGQVFRFTFLQLIKSRSTIFTMLFTLLFAVGALPVMTLLNGGSSGVKQSVTVYLDNRIGIELPELAAKLEETLDPAHVTLLAGPLPDGESEGVGVTLEENDEAFGLTVSWNSADQNVISSVYAIGSTVYDCVNTGRMKQTGFSEKEIAVLKNGPVPSGMTYAEYVNPGEDFPFSDEEDFDSSRYNRQIGYSVIIMMFCIYAVGYIIRSVIEEKQSKLVDLLMVSVRPAALLLGKVLAALCFVFLYMILLFGGMLLSYAVSSRFLDLSAAPGAVGALLNMHPDAVSLIVIVVTGVLGCLAFGLLGGLCGAGCSSIEESSGAMSTCLLLVMAGYMFSLFIPMTGGNLLRIFCVVPVLSMFMAPLQYMAGHIGFGTVALSWVFQTVCVCFLIWLSARVYSSLIMYNGKRLGFGKILAMAGGRKEEGK